MSSNIDKNINQNQSTITASEKTLWQRFATMFSTYFAYHPYGDNLLSDRARVFFLWMLLLTFATAGLEAYTWYQLIVGDPSYKNLTLSDNGYFLPWILAAGVFVSAWMIDSSIVLLSTDSLERWEKQAGIKTEGKTKLTATIDWLQTSVLTPFFQYVPRTLLFIFTVVAVGLGSIVTKERVSLERESVADLATQIDASLFAKKTELESNAGIPALLKEIKQLDNERIQEIAGRVGSGKLGNGPTAQAMASNIQAKNAQLRSAQTAVNTQYAAIEKSAAKLKTGQYDAAELNQLSALGFTVQDPRSNTAVIMRLLERFFGSTDKNGQSKAPTVLWYIHLLNFLFSMHGAILLPFLAMLISKFFQPEAARIYLSEELQGGWKTVQGLDVDRLPLHLPIAAGLAKAKTANMTEFANFWYPFKSAIKHIYGRAESENIIAFIIAATQKSTRITDEISQLAEKHAMLSKETEIFEVKRSNDSDNLQKFADKINKLKAELSTLNTEKNKDQIIAISQAIEGLSNNHEFTSLRDSIDSLSRQIAENKSLLETIRKDVAKAEQQSKNPEIILVLEKIWNYLTSCNSITGNDKDGLEMDLSKLTSELENLASHKTNLNAELDSNKKMGNEKTIEVLNKQMEELVEAEQKLKERILQLEKRLLIYKETIESNKSSTQKN